ncbi:MAG: CHAD domain-containing protein [Alphaproteobacteria bacterium]|nr:CHAD domain-containing protein [Alphaproteobacteria bacterium]
MTLSKQIPTKLYNNSINFEPNTTYITDIKLHDLRISLKKLRYASEFFGNFYKHKKSKKFISLLSQCQELLGLKNDALSTKKILMKLDFGISNEHKIF